MIITITFDGHVTTTAKPQQPVKQAPKREALTVREAKMLRRGLYAVARRGA
jgi:hypothetical protein